MTHYASSEKIVTITRFTQKQIREMVSNGYAINVTDATNRTEIPEYYFQVGVSVGVYGSNGALFMGLQTGRLYAVTDRTFALYAL